MRKIDILQRNRADSGLVIILFMPDFYYIMSNYTEPTVFVFVQQNKLEYKLKDEKLNEIDLTTIYF